MFTPAKTPFVNINTQSLSDSNYIGSRLECVRQLDHLFIYTDTLSGQFMLFDGTSNVHFVFNDLEQVNIAALKAHSEAIDKKNRQFFKAS